MICFLLPEVFAPVGLEIMWWRGTGLIAVAAEFGSRYMGVPVLRSRAGVQLLHERWQGHFCSKMEIDSGRKVGRLLNCWIVWNVFRRCRSMHGGSHASGEAKPATSCGEGEPLCRISKHIRPAHKVSHIKGFVLKVNWQQLAVLSALVEQLQQALT